MSIPTIATAVSAPTPVRAADGQPGGGASPGFGALLEGAVPAAADMAATGLAPAPASDAAMAAPVPAPDAIRLAGAAVGAAPAPVPAADEAAPVPPVSGEVVPALPVPANDVAPEAAPVADLPDEVAPADAAPLDTPPPAMEGETAAAPPPAPTRAQSPTSAAVAAAAPVIVAKAAADVAVAGEPADTAVALPAVKPSTGGRKSASAGNVASAGDAAPDKPVAAPQPAQSADATMAPMPLPQAAMVAQDVPSADVEDAGSALSGALGRSTAAVSAPGGEVAAAGDAPAAMPEHSMPAAGTMSSALMTQSLPGAETKPVSFDAVYAAHQAQAGRETASVVSAQPGRIGHEMGVEIARHAAAGRDEIIIRLDPPEMGRVEVRMSFDRDNSLRAVVAAEHHGALDLLKRDTGDLVRALSDAGIRSDSQSFRFDSRGGDASGQSWRQGQQQDGQSGQGRNAGGDTLAEEEPAYRPLRASGRIDLMA